MPEFIMPQPLPTGFEVKHLDAYATEGTSDSEELLIAAPGADNAILILSVHAIRRAGGDPALVLYENTGSPATGQRLALVMEEVEGASLYRPSETLPWNPAGWIRFNENKPVYWKQSNYSLIHIVYTIVSYPETN